MAENILEDILNNSISPEYFRKWLMKQYDGIDVSLFEQYECNQLEFASYFLNVIREQSSVILQSSCSVETPCKSSQLRKIRTANSSEESDSNVSEQKIDIQSSEKFPTLADGSAKSKSSSTGFGEWQVNEFPSLAKEKSKKCRRLDMSQDKKNQEENPSENLEFVTCSTPKSTAKETDITEYFKDVVNLDGSNNFPGIKNKRNLNKSEPLNTDKFRRNGISAKSKTFSGEPPGGRRELKSSSRAILGDFIINQSNLTDSKKKSKLKKKITPTRVSTSPSEAPAFEDTKSVENGPIKNSEEEPEKLECMNVKKPDEKSVLFNTEKDIPNRNFTTPKKVIPKIKSVTRIDKLKLLSQIYSCLLDENFCQNIMMELCFLASLLVIRDHTSPPELENKCQNDGKNYLNSVHNCVYFAVETLWLQRHVLTLLNLPALKLLAENREIEVFNDGLKEFLEKAYADRQAKEAKKHTYEVKGTRQGNVSFECETDNKDNFTSVYNFHSFRKQRDLFYNILAIWEENHLSSGWEFSVKLDSKIRTLLSICSDSTNLLHLARLFRNQLIMSCHGDYRAEDEPDEEILQFFGSVDRKKILRLRARLRSTPKRQGPCPLPDFMGYQEFFKDFIIATKYTVFHYYLKNSLCDEILRMNEVEFSNDLEEDDSCLDEQTQNRYLQHINELCLLAKFLGFIEFLPYRNDKPWSDRVLSVHCAVRQNLLPLFDVESCLKSASNKHRLTVTVPWIVNYLSMIDFCSSRLKTYQNVWKILILIYRQLKRFKNFMNAFYLKLVLGWIFHLPNFPSEMFYNVDEDVNKDLTLEFNFGLDSYSFIEENILYSVCPYLSEINSILTENTGCNVRHVRPVTQEKSSTSAIQLQTQLEENFLHNQSSSTRRTVEFVSERVSSVAVKYLINEVIPKIKKIYLKELNDSCKDMSTAEDELNSLSERCYRELISECESASWALCSARSEKALNALLSLDLDAAVRDTCTQIATRQSAEKVRRWLLAHVTQAIIRNELSARLHKNSRNVTALLDSSMDSFNSSVTRSAFGEECKQPVLDINDYIKCSVSSVFILHRDLMLKLLEGGNILWEEINSAFRSSYKLLEPGNISLSIEKALLGLTLDLLIIICMRYETDFKKEDFAEMFNLLRRFKDVQCPGSALERIICPRNIALLLRDSVRKSWKNLGNIFLFLMDEKFLTEEQVETQLVSILTQNWEKNEGAIFAELFDQILKQHDACDQFTLLLEYLKETVVNDDDTAIP